MANEPKKVLTSQGLKKYEEELQDLKVNRRKEVAAKIKVAREQGDLSENADYDAAKEEQTEIELRIVELEALLRNVEIVDEAEYDPASINVGSSVVLKDLDFDEEVEYKIVGSSEADSRQGKISNESPVGAGLIGHKVGDTVSIKISDDVSANFKILKITKSEE